MKTLLVTRETKINVVENRNLYYRSLAHVLYSRSHQDSRFSFPDARERERFLLY